MGKMPFSIDFRMKTAIYSIFRPQKLALVLPISFVKLSRQEPCAVSEEQTTFIKKTMESVTRAVN